MRRVDGCRPVPTPVILGGRGWPGRGYEGQGRGLRRPRRERERIAAIERGCQLKLEELGLTLQEGKEVLAELQRLVVSTQVQKQHAELPRCDRCERRLRTGGYYRALFRSAFGNVPLRVRRLVVCPCLPSAKRTFSELSDLLGRSLVAPEWLYLEAKCASLLPFEKVANLLGEVLPVEDGRNAETVRNRLCRVGQRLHEEKIQNELARATFGDPEGVSGEAEGVERRSEAQTVVGLDGCYVRNRHPDPERLFEVIAGCVQGPTGKTRCLAWVRDSRTHAHDVRQAVVGVGGHPSSITILTDGDASLRRMVGGVAPGPMKHVLDWFHVGMKFQVLVQTASGLPTRLGSTRDLILGAIKSAKWHLWHGHRSRTLGLLDLVHRATFRTFVMKADPSLSRTVRKRTADLLAWLGSNADSLPCYRRRYQLGLPIASSPVESVNQVVSRRMVKKQQMRWTKRGAQRLLDVRTEVLNGTLEDAFRRWYPRFRAVA